MAACKRGGYLRSIKSWSLISQWSLGQFWGNWTRRCCRYCAVSVQSFFRPQGGSTGPQRPPSSATVKKKTCLTTNTTQHIIWHGVLHHVLCVFFLQRLHRNRIMVSNRPKRASDWAAAAAGLDWEFLGVYVQTWLLFDMPVVVVCLKTCNYCVTASKRCWFQCCTNSSPEVPRPFFFLFFCKPRRGGWTGFSLHCGGELFFSFFFFFFSPLSWRESYVRGESLPTAPLCFCFSQWANVSLPRPHSLSSRPLSWKHSLAEATQGQACEVGEWGREGGREGGSSSKSHDCRPYSPSPTWGSDAASTFQQLVCHQHDWI